MKVKFKPTHWALILAVCISNFATAGGPDYYKGKGRIAISSDGNYHDDDDWAATAASLMILAKANLQNKLVLYTYSDHIWGSQPGDEAEMRISALEGKTRFGFTNTTFIEAVNNKQQAYNALRDEILASTANDPLFIIAAGPMQVVGTALKRAKAINSSVLNHVTIISHSNWNNFHADRPIRISGKIDFEPVHSGWTWNELKSLHGGTNKVNFVQIIDQNNYTSPEEGFATTNADPTKNLPKGGALWSKWYWMRDHNDANVQWVYSRARSAVRRPDWSDAGMIWYLLQNDEIGGPDKLKNFIGTGIIGNSSTNIIQTQPNKAEINTNFLEISSSPNPANNDVIIKVYDNTNTTELNNGILSIIDFSGKEVYRSNISINESKKINVSDFTSGTYIYRVVDTKSKKVLKADKLIIE